MATCEEVTNLHRAHVIAGKLTIGAHGPAEKPAAQRSVRECGYAMVERVQKNVALDFPFEETVGRLIRVQRRNGPEARHLFAGIIAHADRS